MFKKLMVGFVLVICCAGAQAELLWDGSVVVPAIEVAPKKWVTCPKHTRFDSEDKVSLKCYRFKTFYREFVSFGKDVSISQMLQTHYDAPTGYSAQAVGILPEIYVGQQYNNYSVTSIRIAYRLIPQ